MIIKIYIENYERGGLDTFITTLINNWVDDRDYIILVCNAGHKGLKKYQSEIHYKNFKLIIHKKILIGEILMKFRQWIRNEILYKLLCKAVIISFSYPLFLLQILFLRKLLFDGNPDSLLVVNGGYPGSYSCRAATICWGIFTKNKLSVHNFHNLAIPSGKYNYLENLIDFYVIKYTNKFIGVSKACIESLYQRKMFKNYKKAIFIYNGIRISNPISEKIDYRKKYNIDKFEKICLMLATYEKRKGHAFIIKVFGKVLEHIPSAHLIMCGDGSSKELNQIKLIIDCYQINDHIHVLDFVDNVENLYKDVQLLVIPSQSFESFGLTAVEAMHYKLPVVATTVGGLPEVVEDGKTGYCVDPNDISGYADRIIKLLTDDKLRIEMGENGYKRYRKKFTVERMAIQYNAHLKN